jgi:hypothetical protein
MKMENVGEVPMVGVRCGRRSDYPPARLVEDIRSIAVGQSFETGKEWKARIYMACHRNPPLRVKIKPIDGGKIRVWRIE